MNKALRQILKKYHVSLTARLGSGMEAEVYEHEADTVLKLYLGTVDPADLLRLKEFYASLDRRQIPYALPHIQTVAQEASYTISIEQRLAGVTVASVLPILNNNQLDAMMRQYLNAALAVSNIHAPSDFSRFKLFDPEQTSCLSKGDWHQFLTRHLNGKLSQVAPYLNRDASHFAAKIRQLYSILDAPYHGDHKLIHGDFCPSNLLLNDQNQVAALLDFGLLTMYGDHLFDLATGWVFFDMYDELKAGINGRYLAMLLEEIGEDKRGILYRYVLIYSILSANTYSADCADGHYKWCVANLNNQHYWNHLA